MSKKAMTLALEALGWTDEWRPDGLKAQAITALREALAEQPAQQQERVEWGVDWGRAGDQSCVSIIKRLLGGGMEVVAVEYGPPASKPLVGLTEDEVKHQWEVWRASIPRYVGFATGIEAKLREKNNG